MVSPPFFEGNLIKPQVIIKPDIANKQSSVHFFRLVVFNFQVQFQGELRDILLLVLGPLAQRATLGQVEASQVRCLVNQLLSLFHLVIVNLVSRRLQQKECVQHIFPIPGHGGAFLYQGLCLLVQQVRPLLQNLCF